MNPVFDPYIDVTWCWPEDKNIDRGEADINIVFSEIDITSSPMPQ